MGTETCSADYTRAGRPRREDYDEQEASVHVGVWALSAVAGLMTAIDGGGLLALLPSIMWRFPAGGASLREGRPGREIMNVGAKSIMHIKAHG